MIDLRSDTVTRPTLAMRKAMAEAIVGDDVYQEDPTVNRLEQRAAEIAGKPAAIFLPTGTMGNTIGVKLHTEHGQEILCDSRSHIMNYELAMAAWFTGCLCRQIPTSNGVLTWDVIKREIRQVSPHYAPTGVVEIENTHNMGGGSVYPVETINEICDGAHAMGLKVHMDGARVFNAATAVGRPVSEIVAKVDTVTFCLSKALGAPVGSMLAGTQADMAKARLYRKRLGGGMRQAGVLAAAGLIALEESPKLLAADHANARWVAGQLQAIAGIAIDPATVETNIVFFEVKGTGKTSAQLSALFKERGLLINGINPERMRIVTHFDAGREACEKAIEIIRSVVV